MFKTNWALNNLGHIGVHNAIGARFNLVVNAKDYGTDGTGIQAAIDAANSSGIGSVYIPLGTWLVSQTIQCRSGVDLVLDRQTIIRASADVDVIKLAPNVSIEGGRFETHTISFTHSVFLFDGADQFYMTYPVYLNRISLFGGHTGNGIRMTVSKVGDTAQFVFGVICNCLSINRFENGLLTEYSDQGGSTWAGNSANMFTNLIFDGNVHAIVLDIGSGANLFSNLTMQSDDQGLDFIVCDGNRNIFTNVAFWDFYRPTQTKAVKLGSGSLDNHVVMNYPLTVVDDLGTNLVETTWTSW